MGSELRRYRLIAAALLTTFNEIDMTAVNELRARYKDAFLERHGIKLGFMSFFVKAAVDALRAPSVRADTAPFTRLDPTMPHLLRHRIVP